MSNFIPTWIFSAALLLAWGGCGFYLGDVYSNAAWLKKQAAQARTAFVALQAAQARGDALSAGLLVQQVQIDQLNQESHRAITTATTGRTCLDAAALRVLKHAPGITTATVPQAASSAAATLASTARAAGDGTDFNTGASAASDASVSTDTQVATWAVDAAARFEICRTRLDALIAWNESAP